MVVGGHERHPAATSRRSGRLVPDRGGDRGDHRRVDPVQVGLAVLGVERHDRRVTAQAVPVEEHLDRPDVPARRVRWRLEADPVRVPDQRRQAAGDQVIRTERVEGSRLEPRRGRQGGREPRQRRDQPPVVDIADVAARRDLGLRVVRRDVREPAVPVVELEPDAPEGDGCSSAMTDDRQPAAMRIPASSAAVPPRLAAITPTRTASAIGKSARDGCRTA